MSAAVSSHLRVTLASVSHLRLVGEPHTVGCLPMCCPLIHCTGCCYCEDVLCLEGFSARSPGSWQGGSWVSALLSGVFCWTPSQDLALFAGVLCLFLCKIQFIECQQTCFIMGSKTEPKKVVKNGCDRGILVATGLGTHKEEKV